MTTKTAQRDDPFLAFRFRVRLNIDGKLVGGFSECSGLELKTKVEDYPEGGENHFVWKLPGRIEQTNITLKRGIVDRMLWDWYSQLSQGKVVYYEGSIALLNSLGLEVMRWEFTRAFPARWSGPDLNASQNNVAVETLELCHHGLSVA